MTTDYGTTEYEGATITLTNQATLSNRVFTGWWGDVVESESYTAEYKADGTDENGNDVEVYWQFDVIKGQEPEDESNYPWDNEHISKVVTL